MLKVSKIVVKVLFMLLFLGLILVVYSMNTGGVLIFEILRVLGMCLSAACAVFIFIQLLPPRSISGKVVIKRENRMNYTDIRTARPYTRRNISVDLLVKEKLRTFNFDDESIFDSIYENRAYTFKVKGNRIYGLSANE